MRGLAFTEDSNFDTIHAPERAQTIVFMDQKISKAKDLSTWYLGVVKDAQLADYAPVKGSMIIRPNGYAIWENIMSKFDIRIKALGARNAYFPLLIPESFLHREKQHVEGFSPELAVVTVGGGEKLDEPLVVRPTSETIMYDSFSKWISSWRDLPLKVNQWCNVVRWEKRTFPFLRTSEFLWQEGHTAHATKEEADHMTLDALKEYKDFIEGTLAIPVMTGKKSEREKFAGALYTTACEALMPDGKALQCATSHQLGQNFSKAEAFAISFQTQEKGKRNYVWQTSWGMSTRILGALIMTHGDDKGLILPPKIAPLLVVVVPIYKTDTDKTKALKSSNDIKKKLEGFTVHVDDRSEFTPGYKFHDWELQGVPFRIELGIREIAAKTVTLVRRDSGEKEVVAISKLHKRIEELSEAVQKELFRRASNFLKENTFTAKTFAEFKDVMDLKRGFVVASWCGNERCELQIKNEAKATARVIPLTQPKELGKCVVCQEQAKHEVYWAQAY